MKSDCTELRKILALVRSYFGRNSSFYLIESTDALYTNKRNEAVLTEAAAICLYLAESFPDSKLEISKGDPRRSEYLKWVFFGPSCLEPAILDRMFDRKKIDASSSGWGNFETLVDVISDRLGSGPYIFGNHFSAVDIILGSQLGWGKMIGKLPETPQINSYLATLDLRPARKRTFEMEEKQEWPI